MKLEDMMIEPDMESEIYCFSLLYKAIYGTKKFNEKFGIIEEDPEEPIEVKVGDRVKLDCDKYPENSHWRDVTFVVASEPYFCAFEREKSVELKKDGSTSQYHLTAKVKYLKSAREECFSCENAEPTKYSAR